ncbi:MAG TPA: hypothetical protein VEF06_00850 [Bryobacteraceae bacterium]|nr:hypothetical protein [Bryobacteraceae bacterium]
MKISDEQLREALSLFRESVHELHPHGAARPVRSFAAWRIIAAAFAMLAVLAALPLYRHRQSDLANKAARIDTQDDALLREVESDISLSVPPPMQQLELLMAYDSMTNAERTK